MAPPPELGHLVSLENWELAEGSPFPLGVTWLDDQEAWNFALYSQHATAVTLLLYTQDDPINPIFQYQLSEIDNKSSRIWHCMVFENNAGKAKYYAYRIDGPKGLESGHRFDPGKILLDPLATAVYFPPQFSRDICCQPGPTHGHAPLGILPKAQAPDTLPSIAPPRYTHDAVIYEVHVKGFTAHPSSGISAEKRGTFLGLIEKIPYLKELGVTVVELLPIHQFDPQEGNYWGYMTLNFFAPHQGYAHHDPLVEFQAMVRAFHEADLEIWLDVVYNHTCEGDATGPTYSWRGIDNKSYYLTDARGHYWNDSGCGNTLRCAHPATRSLILSSLKHWAGMGVDGFRFDLASVLARDAQGQVLVEDAPVVSEISVLATLLDVRLVAEAWDIGAYLLGQCYPGLLWRQWNGKFRDDIRAFVKGDPGKVPALMRRLYGSDDLFPDGPGDVYHPYQSVNFITAHDGFCLYDLVSYNHKHNEMNGHGNTDGTDANLSWNCGWEGDIHVPPEILRLRRQQVKNFFCLLMLANGTPMFCAGDEFLNTQYGNNNPYNQDNEITWLDWSKLQENRDIFRFFQKMIAFRKSRQSLGRSRFWREDVTWYGPVGETDLRPESHTLAYALSGARFQEGSLYVMINAFWEPVRFTVQEGEPQDWQRAVDTSLPSPEDIAEPSAYRALDSLTYTVAARSVVVLVRDRIGGGSQITF